MQSIACAQIYYLCMELLVQKYLRSGKTLDNLKEEHGINYRVVNGKISLSYHQLDSKETDKLARECRGLILREENYDIVALPMFRFFNYGDPNAAEIDWDTAVYVEKEDGSLVIGYFDDVQKKWMVATRSMPEAGGYFDDSRYTFAELIDMTVAQMATRKNPNIDYVPDFNSMMIHMENDHGGQKVKNYTFCMELTGPYNRIVCQYDQNNLSLLAVRNKLTGKELNPAEFELELFDLKHVKSYSFNGIQDMINIVKSWSPAEHEGIVVRDSNYNRIKVKSPQYIAYNHARDSLISSWRGCAEIILMGKEDDIIPMMPTMIGDRINKLKKIISKLIKQAESDYESIKDIDDMKEFALKAKDMFWPAPLFAIKRGHVDSVHDFIFSKSERGEVPTSMLKSILTLCEKIDPSLKQLNQI